MTVQQTQFRRLGEHLSRVCAALDDLAYHLDVHMRFLADGPAARLDRALADVERSAAAVAAADAERARFLQTELPEWARHPLSTLVGAAEEPWRGLLQHQHHEMEVLLAAVADLGDRSSRAARLAAHRNQETLHVITGAPAPLATGFSGRPAVLRAAPLLVDRSA